jgi:hypothetical protein
MTDLPLGPESDASPAQVEEKVKPTETEKLDRIVAETAPKERQPKKSSKSRSSRPTRRPNQPPRKQPLPRRWRISARHLDRASAGNGRERAAHPHEHGRNS